LNLVGFEGPSKPLKPSSHLYLKCPNGETEALRRKEFCPRLHSRDYVRGNQKELNGGREKKMRDRVRVDA
jgi:hypothetical protein